MKTGYLNFFWWGDTNCKFLKEWFRKINNIRWLINTVLLNVLQYALLRLYETAKIFN